MFATTVSQMPEHVNAPNSTSSAEKNNYRPWVKVRLSASDAHAADIVANWKSQKHAARHLADAILLQDALLRGDIDYLQKHFPWLVLAFSGGKKRPAKKIIPFPSSSVSSPDEEITAIDPLRDAVVEVCKVDPLVNDRAIRRTGTKLSSASYTPDDVRVWYSRIWQMEWPGNKGDTPKLKDLEVGIFRVRTLNAVSSTPDSQSITSSEQDTFESLVQRKLAENQSPYYDRLIAEQEASEELFESPVSEPEISALPPVDSYFQSHWQGLMSTLTLQLSKATYANWVSKLSLLAVKQQDKSCTFVVSVPNPHVQTWLVAHLVESMTKHLSTTLRRPCTIHLVVDDEPYALAHSVIHDGYVLPFAVSS